MSVVVCTSLMRLIRCLGDIWEDFELDLLLAMKVYFATFFIVLEANPLERSSVYKPSYYLCFVLPTGH